MDRKAFPRWTIGRILRALKWALSGHQMSLVTSDRPFQSPILRAHSEGSVDILFAADLTE